MKSIPVTSLKLTLPFKAGELPQIDPANPRFALMLGPLTIMVSVNAKAARKLAMHQGGAVLQGRLMCEGGKLVLAEAGFQMFDAKPAESTSAK